MNPRARVAVASLALSASAFVGIAVHESYRETAYFPTPEDRPTLGYGATESVRMGDKTTPDRALVRLLQDADKFQQAVRRCAPVPMHQHEFDAYVSISYNIGSGAFCSSTMVRKLKAGDYEGGCREILRWDRQAGRVLRGLTIRREAEYKQCIGTP